MAMAPVESWNRQAVAVKCFSRRTCTRPARLRSRPNSSNKAWIGDGEGLGRALVESPRSDPGKWLPRPAAAATDNRSTTFCIKLRSISCTSFRCRRGMDRCGRPSSCAITGCCAVDASPPTNCSAASSFSFLRWMLRVKSITEFCAALLRRWRCVWRTAPPLRLGLVLLFLFVVPELGMRHVAAVRRLRSSSRAA